MRKLASAPLRAGRLWAALGLAAAIGPAQVERWHAHDRRGVRLTQTRGSVTRAALALLAATAVTAGCASNSSTRPPPATSHSPASSPTGKAAVGLVGEWKRVITCQELVSELDKAGLAPLAPYVWLGQTSSTGLSSYAAGSPKPTKAHPCTGALNRAHSHFFSQSGQFGSLDWLGGQVDNGPYPDPQQQHRLHRQPPHRGDIPLPHPARRHAHAVTRAHQGHAPPSARAPAEVQRGVVGRVGRLRRAHLEARPVPKLVLVAPRG